MILLLGASGYVGQALAEALQKRDIAFNSLSRRQFDYTDFHTLVDLLRQRQPSFLINAAGHTGKPNVDACESERAETLNGNVLLPLTISHACQITDTPWGQVSSGCIYNGAKIFADGAWRIETDLTQPEFRRALREAPDTIRGFCESDEPNFTYRRPPCSFYSGSKALAEEALASDPRVYVWRLRIPFHHIDHPRNYLTKLQTYAKIYENVNSLTQLDDFADACLALWERRAPFGVYNITNPGYVSTAHVVQLMQRYLKSDRRFEFWESNEVFYRDAARAPRSNCILDTGKLAAAGIRLRHVEEALADALERWQPRATA